MERLKEPERLKKRHLFVNLEYSFEERVYKLRAEQVLESNINPYKPVPSEVEVSYDNKVFAKIQFDRLKNVDAETLFFAIALAPPGMTLESLVLFLKTWIF